MSTFDKAFEHVIGHEGGYVNDPNDAGGETMYGISKRAYPNEDIKNLTLDRAKQLYKRDYWDKLKLDELATAEVQIELFDTAVNMGVGTAAKFLQEALNLLNRSQKDYADIVVDGGIGPNTIKAYNACKRRDNLYKILNCLQAERYMDIVRKNPVQEKFLNGWLNRVDFVRFS